MVLAMVSTLLAVGAFLVSVLNFDNRLNDIQISRVKSGTDSCYILRTLVFHAYTQAHVKAAGQLLKNVGLGNCIIYGHSVTKLNGGK